MSLKNFLSASVLAAASVMFSGCEWSSTSSSDSWSDSYNDMNFAGTYRTASTQTSSGGTEASPEDVQVKNQSVGTFSGTTGSAALSAPVVAGSASLTVGSVGFSDNGDGTLKISGAAGSGSINYSSGACVLKINSDMGTLPIRATYTWQKSASSTIADAGSGITAITIQQSGQKLTMNCNNGLVMSGRFTTVNQIRASDTTGAPGLYNAQFEVSGAGYKMVGTLHSSDSARILDGTLTSGGSAWDIRGSASPAVGATAD